MQPATQRRIGIAALAVTFALIVTAGAVAATFLGREDGPTITMPAPAPTPAPADPSPTGADWAPTPPALPDGVTYAYAHIDTASGTLQLGGHVERGPLDLLLTPGLAQDYLRSLDDRGQERSDNDEQRIRAALAGDTDAVAWLGEQVDGPRAAFTRISQVCQLDDVDTDSLAASPLDIARYGACLSEGVIADAGNASWVLDQMRAERAGIGESRGDNALAQQNSSVRDGDQYRSRCLAVGPWWVAAVLVDYDQERGEPYGRAACALIADTLFPPDAQKVPENTSSPAPSVDVS